MTHATLLESSSLISEEIFREKVARAAAESGGGKEENWLAGLVGGSDSGSQQGVDEHEQEIQNPVLVFIFNRHLMILKEVWANWVFVKDQAELKGYKANKHTDYDMVGSNGQLRIVGADINHYKTKIKIAMEREKRDYLDIQEAQENVLIEE